MTRNRASRRRRFFEVLISRNGMFCHWCGYEVVRTLKVIPNQATLDHVTPRSEGGANSLSNLVLACYACNQNRAKIANRERRDARLARTNGSDGLKKPDEASAPIDRLPPQA
jgi:5-methylcytosine-specific restriction endonuclease McrA